MNAKIESEDLLTEILIRLPPKSLFRFISVSKGWRDLIKHPLFLAAYSKLRRRDRLRPLAYIPRTFMISRHYRDEPMNILSIPGNPKIDKVPKRFGYFVSSSNGLILCRGPRRQYHIINPLTRRWVPLPRASTCSHDIYFRFVGFICEENTVELRSDYIVVRICDNQYKIKDNIMRIATYSSRTGKWANSELVATGEIEHLLDVDYFALPSVASGVFHWCISQHGVVMVYDPGEKNDHLQLIELPESMGGRYPFSYKKSTVTRSPEDILMCGMVVDWNIDGGDVVKLWRLDKGECGSYRRPTTIPREEWVPMHQVVLPRSGLKITNYRVLYQLPYLAGFISWDPIVVLIRVLGKYIIYNLETESGELVRYRGRFSGDAFRSGDLCPFFQSSFLSSYAL